MTPRKKKETAPEQAPDTAAVIDEAASAEAPTAVDDAAEQALPDDSVPSAESILTYAPDERGGQEGSSAEVIDQMIAFHLEGQRYGLPIDSVQEIQQIVTFSQQNGSGAVVGMINLRGAVIPAIDMRALVGLPHLDYHVNTPMIICRTSEGLVALVVDEVEDVITLPADCLSPPPKLHNLSDRMIGVCRLGTELVYLLGVEQLVAPLGLGSGRGC